MSFQIKILLLSFAVSVFISIIVIPTLRKLKVGQSERDDGPKTHLKKKGTTTMGGLILIISTLLLSAFLYIDYSADQPEIATRLLPMIFVTIGFGLIGFIDDFKKVILHSTDGIKPTTKMAGLLVISIVYVLMLVFAFKNGTDIYIPFFKTYLNLPAWIYIPFAVIVILSTTNAVNLTDGIDGLSTSVTTIMLTCLTVVSIIWGVKETTIFGCIVIGPIIETISVILQVVYYKKTKKRLFKMAPIHHHFEMMGWKENKIVSTFSIITLIASIIGILAI